MTRDENSIRALLAKYEESLNESDAESIAGLYAANGIFMPQGFPTALRPVADRVLSLLQASTGQ